MRTLPKRDRLLDSSAMALAQMLRDGEVSASTLVETHINRIRQVDRGLNALIADRFDAARAEAAKADERLKSGDYDPEREPLLGLPCSMKEFISVEGMPLTGGLLTRRHEVADRDAIVVRRLRDAGAIILGVSNIPEGGLWMETDNLNFGCTNNPWDKSRTPGGSSGGEAALVAAGAAPFGVGSDVGGSIRIPSAFCGIWGHKPSGLLVPCAGHYPEPEDDIRGFLGIGPMTRAAEDLYPLLRIMAGPDPDDSFVQDVALPDPASIDMRDVTVYPLETNGGPKPDRSVRRAVRRAAEALRRQGAKIKELPPGGLKHSFFIWALSMADATGPTYEEMLNDGQRLNIPKEILKSRLGRGSFTEPALVTMFAERIVQHLPGWIARMRAKGATLQAELEEALGPRGVLLHPPYTKVAPKHKAALKRPFDPGYTAIFNILEFPVTQVPMGFDRRGLPLGVQVVGRRFNDALTLAVGQALEPHGGWIRAEP